MFNMDEMRTILELIIPFCNVETLINLICSCKWCRTYIYRKYYLRDAIEKENIKLRCNINNKYCNCDNYTPYIFRDILAKNQKCFLGGWYKSHVYDYMTCSIKKDYNNIFCKKITYTE